VSTGYQFFCETPDGEEAHINAHCAGAAAEVFVQDLANAALVREGALTYVRVTYSQCTSPEVTHWEVEVEYVADATAKRCDGDGLGFES